MKNNVQTVQIVQAVQTVGFPASILLAPRRGTDIMSPEAA
jgi:hypothetical protein